jgi:hypothetical protein
VKKRAEGWRFPEEKSGLALIADILQLEREFHVPARNTRGRAVAELTEHRPKFCEALRWLCSPKPEPKALTAEEQDAIVASTGTLRWGRYPEIDQESESFVAYFEDHGVHFRRHLGLKRGRLLSWWLPDHMIDLFCVFLLAECEGKTPSEMPLKLCGKCSKLFFTDLEGGARERKKFCSTSCQQGDHWTKSNRARSDFGFVERLLENDSIKLRQRLAKPAVQERLSGIRSKWKDWQALMLKVKRVDALAKE